jgi:hypothetical protein
VGVGAVTFQLRLPYRVSSHKPDVLYPWALAASRDFSGIFRVVAVVATAAWATARCRQRMRGLWIVGLLHSPSLTFHRLRLMTVRVCEGLPVQARLGVGSTKLPGPPDLRFSFGDSIRLALSSIRGALVVRPSGRPSRVRAVVGLLSWGCQRSAPPSTWVPGVHSQWFRLLRRAAVVLHSEDCFTLARCHLRPGAATSRTRSALAVPPGFDGLLHLALCRFVAPCCRSWGSPCFRSSESVRPRPIRPPRRVGVRFLSALGSLPGEGALRFRLPARPRS